MTNYELCIMMLMCTGCLMGKLVYIHGEIRKQTPLLTIMDGITVAIAFGATLAVVKYLFL